MTTNCRCLSHNGFLTAYGYAVTAQRSLEGLDVREGSCEVDKVVSVRAVDRDRGHVWDDALIDNQHRRFLNEVR